MEKQIFLFTIFLVFHTKCNISCRGENALFLFVVSLTFQVIFSLFALSMKYESANTFWFTFKKQNNKTGQKLKT